MIPLDTVIIFAAGGIAGGGVVGVPLHYFLTRKVKDKIKNGLDYNTLKTRVVLHEKEIELLLEKVLELEQVLKIVRSKIG